MLKRSISLLVSIMMVLTCLGSFTLTVSAATETVRWSESFNVDTVDGTTGDDYLIRTGAIYTYPTKNANDNTFERVAYSGNSGNTEILAAKVEDGVLHTTGNQTKGGVATEGYVEFIRAFGSGKAGFHSDKANKDLTVTKWVSASDFSNADNGMMTEGAWTFSFDFKPVNAAGEVAIHSLYGSTNKTYNTLFYYAGGTSFTALGRLVNVTLGQNHRISYAFDGTGKAALYINGKKIADVTDDAYKYSYAFLFKIGTAGSGAIDHYIDNFKVSDKVSGFYGENSAFDATIVHNSYTVLDDGLKGTIIIPEADANTTLQDLIDGLTTSADVIAYVDGSVFDGDYEELSIGTAEKLVVDTGYAMREYDVLIDVDLFTSTEYTVDHVKKTISNVVSGIKKSDFLAKFSPIEGIALKIKDDSTEIIDDNIEIEEGMTLVSVNGSVETEYTIYCNHYWIADFESDISGDFRISGTGNRLKWAYNNALVFDTFWTQGYKSDGTLEDKGLSSNYYTNDVLDDNNDGNKEFRHYVRNTIADGWYITTKLIHNLRADGKGSGDQITTNGAYSFEFSFMPYDIGSDGVDSDFVFDMKGTKADNSEFAFITYDKGTYKAFGETIDLSSVSVDSKGFYNFKVDVLGNGYANVYANGTKVAANVSGGTDIKAVGFYTTSYTSGTGAAYYIDNIDLYPIVYNVPDDAISVKLYKDAVDDANIVTTKSDLNATTKYIARADILSYKGDVPAMLVLAVYNETGLAKAKVVSDTISYGDEDGFIDVEIEVAEVGTPKEIKVFLWNSASLKPYLTSLDID